MKNYCDQLEMLCCSYYDCTDNLKFNEIFWDGELHFSNLVHSCGIITFEIKNLARFSFQEAFSKKKYTIEYDHWITVVIVIRLTWPNKLFFISFYRLSRKDKAFLWEKRHYCHIEAISLPKILASAPNWDWTNLPEIYSLLQQWPPLPPLTALELLDSR